MVNGTYCGTMAKENCHLLHRYLLRFSQYQSTFIIVLCRVQRRSLYKEYEGLIMCSLIIFAKQTSVCCSVSVRIIPNLILDTQVLPIEMHYAFKDTNLKDITFFRYLDSMHMPFACFRLAIHSKHLGHKSLQIREFINTYIIGQSGLRPSCSHYSCFVR